FRGRLDAAVDTSPPNLSDPAEGRSDPPAGPNAGLPTEPPASPPPPLAPGQSGPSDQPEPPSPEALRRRRRVIFAVAAVGVFTLAMAIGLAIASFTHVPYFVLSPGDVTRTQDLIKVHGAPQYPTQGSIDYVTVSVSSREITALQYAWVRWFDHSDT